MPLFGLRMPWEKRWTKLSELTSSRSKSSVLVTETSAMRMSAVFACVRILSETVASLPLMVYTRNSTGKYRAWNHPLYKILHDKPNSEMTAYSFFQMLVSHMCLWGNAYALIDYDRSGTITELWPLLPNKMQIRRSSSGTLDYLYTLPDGTVKTFVYWQIIHLKMLSLDGVVGLSPISYAREAIGLGLAAEEFGSRFFSNGTNLGGFIEMPERMSDEAHKRFKDSIKEAYTGLSKAHKLVILEEGGKFNKIGIPPNDAQWIESRKYQATEIARIYRVPPHMIADLERATFSNIEQQSMEFLRYSIYPWLVNIQQECNSKLLLESESYLFTEYLVDGILRGDIKTRYEAYAIGRQNGWLSANDIREMENLNRIDGGDEYLSPLNMVPASMIEAYYQAIISKQGNTNGR